MKSTTLAFLLLTIPSLALSETRSGAEAKVCRDSNGEISEASLIFNRNSYSNKNATSDILTYTDVLGKKLEDIDDDNYKQKSLNRWVTAYDSAFKRFQESGESSPNIIFTSSPEDQKGNGCQDEPVFKLDFEYGYGVQTSYIRGDILKHLSQADIGDLLLNMTLSSALVMRVKELSLVSSLQKDLVAIPVQTLTLAKYLKAAFPEMSFYKSGFFINSNMKIISEDEIVIARAYTNMNVVINGKGELDIDKTLEKGSHALFFSQTNYDSENRTDGKAQKVCEPKRQIVVTDRDGNKQIVKTNEYSSVYVPFGKIDVEVTYPKQICMIYIPLLQLPFDHADLSLKVGYHNEAKKIESIKISPVKDKRYSTSIDTAINNKYEITVE